MFDGVFMVVLWLMVCCLLFVVGECLTLMVVAVCFLAVVSERSTVVDVCVLIVVDGWMQVQMPAASRGRQPPRRRFHEYNT